MTFNLRHSTVITTENRACVALCARSSFAAISPATMMQSIVLFAFVSQIESWGTRALRLLHWGPAFGVCTMMTVILTSIHFFVQLFPLVPQPTFKSLLHFSVGLILTLCSVYSYIASILDGPGFVPLGWRPAKKSQEKHMQFCDKCECFKVPRSHHCSRCNRCVLKMDHHCIWVNGCVGFQNQRSFFITLLVAVIGTLYSLFIFSSTVYRVVHFIPNDNQQYIYLSMRGLFFLLLSMAINIFTLFGFGPLLYTQTKILLKNQTTIENLIVLKAEKRQRKLPFVYPYNLGIWANVSQVLLDNSLDGFTWPVRNDCYQYTLTDEQIAQRKELIDNGSIYRIIAKYNGHYLPLFSQGLWVTLHAPWSSKSRMQVELGDRILVSERRKLWMYGSKENCKPQQEGWFPERCGRFVQMQSEVKNANQSLNGPKDASNNNDQIDSRYEIDSDSDVSSDFSLNELVASLIEENGGKKDD